MGLDLQAGQVVADVRDPASREMSAATVSLVATAVLGIVPYRHEYVLMVAWATTFLIALLALVLVGARAFRWDLIGSVAGSALLGSAAGVLASVLDSSDPDGFPSGAVPGAIIGAIMLGLVGLFFNSSVGGADDPVARRVKASLSGTPSSSCWCFSKGARRRKSSSGGRGRRRTVRARPSIRASHSGHACRSTALEH